jgi:hypothetical protein
MSNGGRSSKHRFYGMALDLPDDARIVTVTRRIARLSRKAVDNGQCLEALHANTTEELWQLLEDVEVRLRTIARSSAWPGWDV